MHKKVPFIIVILVALAFVGSKILPLSLLRAFLAISITLKSGLTFILPLLIFGLIFSTFQRLGENASKIFGIALALLCCSNFLATYLSHFVGEAVYAINLPLEKISAKDELIPLFDLQFPKIIPNALAMVVAMICGILVPKNFPRGAQKLSTIVDIFVSRLLKYITLIVPFFLFGFLLKMQYDGIVMTLVRQYAIIVAVIIIATTVYLLLFYFWLIEWTPKQPG
jgi:hypothetical protein